MHELRPGKTPSPNKAMSRAKPFDLLPFPFQTSSPSTRPTSILTHHSLPQPSKPPTPIISSLYLAPHSQKPISQLHHQQTLTNTTNPKTQPHPKPQQWCAKPCGNCDQSTSVTDVYVSCAGSSSRSPEPESSG